VKDFVEYLNRLAPEGETFLLVRQKPQLKEGEMQYHADGAIKATWPAMLPTAKVKPDWAIYGNTASFIIDRFKDGHASASAANCEYVLVMVLDDVGDPDKAPNVPPLEPTWKIETSPGSFQWGYVFSEQPTKAEFSAAIRAIADAGYTDPGACNAVRNFRIPGSVNMKPGRNNFASTLVEFHPERDFTLEQICAALNVTPGQAEDAYRPIRISDDGTDDVMVWLSDNGMLLSKPNQEGWAGVICPNNAQHTDGNPEGRYLPASRAYCCLHSHCIDLDSSVFLKWVGDNGGPKHTPGLREELLAAAMEGALSKLAPTPEYPDAAAAVIAEVERKQQGRVDMADWYHRFAYVQSDDGYFDMIDRRSLSRGAFNATFRHVSCKSIHSLRKIEASICYDENRQEKGAHVLAGLTYAAGETILCARDGLVYGNQWRNARPDVSGVSPTGIERWLDHVERLLPDERERQHVLDVMAFKVQHPGKKINHAVLHIGVPGAGKDLMWLPMQWAIDGGTSLNVENIQNADIMSQWGYSYEREMLVFQELRQAEARDRRALENHLKPIIAAPPEYLTVNRKGQHPYQALNRLFVLAFSNESIPITLPSDDRRWFVVRSSAGRMGLGEGKQMFDWYHAGGFACIAAWLHQRDVSAFNPGESPFMTDAKSIMIESGMSGAESFLTELMRGRSGEFNAGAVGGPWQALCDRLTGQAPQGMKLPVAALMHAFREAGWVDMGLLKSRANTTKKHIYAAPDMVNKTRSELRDLVQPENKTTLMRVK
jgi:hypothetical protein